jgi:hypothetical protein
MEFIPARMKDGSVHFLSLPESVSFRTLVGYVSALPGVTMADFVTDEIVEMWLDFAYCGEQFSINNQFGEYWFFANNPNCSKGVMDGVATHFSAILARGTK